MKTFREYQRGIILGHKNLQMPNVSNVFILIRFLLNDIIRYYSCKNYIMGNVLNNNIKLTERNKYLEEENRKLRLTAFKGK